MEQEFRAYGTLFSFVCTDGLVSPCEQYALCGRSAGHHAFARSLVAFQWNTADRGFRFVLHLDVYKRQYRSRSNDKPAYA